MQILHDLLYGNIDPYERHKDRSAEYKKAFQKLFAAEEKLLEKLTDEERELFEDCMDRNRELSSISELEIFSDGFRLGSKLTYAVFTEDE